MTDRFFVLLGLAALAGIFLALLTLYRRRWTPQPERLSVDELGLELMTGCCAFVLFTTPSCRPCQAARGVIRRTIDEHEGPVELVEVEVTKDPEIALRYEVRTIPTVFLITASGHVIQRWREVPDPREAKEALTGM